MWVFNGTEKVKFDWASNIGVDAVIVKSQDANTFVYDPPGPESLGDNGLYSPENKNISHIEFCYDLELQVSKTASTSLKRTFNWTINKSVTPDKWDLFKGDSGKSEYTVEVTKDQGTDSDWKVTGTITVTSPINNARVTGITDVISQGAVNTNGTILACAKNNANSVAIPSGANPVTLNTGDKLECTYEALLQSGDNGKNTATATTDTAKLGNGTGTAAVDFSQATINKVRDSITVNDDFAGAGSPWTFSNSGSEKYSRTFNCNNGDKTYNNTATIQETGQSSSAAVTVKCYELNVSKNVKTSLDRKWDWTVDKKVDGKKQLDLTLALGTQSYNANYTVTYNATKTDSNWKVSGTITVTNPAPIAAEVKNVTDLVSPGISATITECNGAAPSFPYTVAKDGGTLTCRYSADLPDASSRTNTATAELQNYNYNHDLNGGNQTAGTTGFRSSEVAVSFGNATVTETDEEITVSDTFAGSNVNGTVTASQAPKTFNYSRQIGPYNQCGNQPPVVNTADFVTNDTGTKGQDTATVNVNVPCNGCTLTIGYWKTHGYNSPGNQADMVTPLLPITLGNTEVTNAEQAANILKLDEASNGLKKLQAQLLAAKLNIKNGADGSQIASTIANADSYLAKWGTNWSSLTKAQKAKVLDAMTKLDNYNNGLIGPGHCSEEKTTT
jgi:hypothetical protein